ncbi:hypothetical protein MHK_005397 [Candidatus Magnetomorum sp. HK-1]|nr:hypothetical protein MHK_005397 [Candidatus Magnetomorum sp. HK-1]
MLFGKYRFSSCFQNQALLPPYKGSTFRGVFGHALKNIVCTFTNRTCDQCLLVQQCVYVKIFEPRRLKIPAMATMKQMTSVPSPFVIEPPMTQQTHYQKNDSFDFDLLLFGKINENFPYFIYAFDQMGTIGVGKYIDGQRGQFILNEVSCQDQIIYASKKERLHDIEHIEILNLEPDLDLCHHTFLLKLTLETPLRFKIDRRLSTTLTFEQLVRAMLRRVSFLLTCYGSGNPNLDYKRIIQKALSIKTIDNQLQWKNWSRYSARQDRKMDMGGLIGSITYEGELSEFIPFIKFCSTVHLGKQTAFGLGKMSWEVIARDKKTCSNPSRNNEPTQQQKKCHSCQL